MSDSITTAQGLRAIPSCKREDRYWWPRCFGTALLAAVDFDLDIGDDPVSEITPDVVIVCEVYTQHGDEIGALMSDDALRSLAELIAAGVNSDAAESAGDDEFDRALDAAVAHAADRRAAHAEGLRIVGEVL